MRRFLKSHAEAIAFLALLLCIYVVLIPAMDAHDRSAQSCQASAGR